MRLSLADAGQSRHEFGVPMIFHRNLGQRQRPAGGLTMCTRRCFELWQAACLPLLQVLGGGLPEGCHLGGGFLGGCERNHIQPDLAGNRRFATEFYRAVFYRLAAGRVSSNNRLPSPFQMTIAPDSVAAQ